MPADKYQQAIDAVNAALAEGYPAPGHNDGRHRNAVSRAAEMLGRPRPTVTDWLKAAKKEGREPDWSLAHAKKTVASDVKPNSVPPPTIDTEKLVSMLRKSPLALEEVAVKFNTSKGAALDALEALGSAGLNVHELGGKWSIEKTPALRSIGGGTALNLTSDKDNFFRIGFVTDNHIGSKYARLDVLHDLYDRFQRRGITTVLNAGNYIDGEARFNKFDLKIHGMEPQLRFLAEEYPQRPGITTYFVAGDDHEGWYGQREGVDIGRYTERVMRDAGRTDFIYLGYMEADVGLVNANTGATQRGRVIHPGGGSAYAISYAPQKLVESFDGGDKPAVVFIGHYHKMEIMNYRNCWCIQGGTTEDQTPFMSKNKLSAHVGGIIVTLEQDPRTGAIISCNDMYRYFNQGYYAEEGERFSYAGDVRLPVRSLIPT